MKKSSSNSFVKGAKPSSTARSGSASAIPKPPKKAGIPQSQILAEETKRMEEQLEMVKKIAAGEMDRKVNNDLKAKQHGKGSIWASASTKEKITGHADRVLAEHKLAQKAGRTMQKTAQSNNTFVNVISSNTAAGSQTVSSNLSNALKTQAEED